MRLNANITLAFCVQILAFLACAVSTIHGQGNEDFSTSGNVCFGGQCMAPADAEYLIAERKTSTPVAFRSFSVMTSFLAAENAATGDYRLKQLVGSKVPQMFPFKIQRQMIPSFAGCYALTGTNLLLTRSQGNLTYTRCYQAAVRSGDTFFSLQNFGQCTSGSAIPSTAGAQPATNCMFSCTFNTSIVVGESVQECGNSVSAAVYSINSGLSENVVDSITNGTQVFLFIIISFNSCRSSF